jgi:predicted nucleic-acid-binding protein
MRVGVDTNLLVRLIIDDDSGQAAAVERLAREHHLVVTPTALLETEWVLRRVIRLDRKDIIGGFDKLLRVQTATFLHRNIVIVAMQAFASGCDFADALHALSAADADVFATFDRAFARQARLLDYMPPVRVLPATGPFQL